jgi:mRNA interferase HigB
MRIITYKKISEYSATHADADISLSEWYDKTEESEWTCFADVKATFNSMDNVGNKRYVFNIKGNSYRLIALIIIWTKNSLYTFYRYTCRIQ